MRLLLPLLALLAVLTGCASPGGAGGDAGDTGRPDDAAQGSHDLLVEVDPGDGTAPERWTLSCEPAPDGTHPDPGAACAHLRGLEDPFAPLPADVMCTEQYGGPQTAKVSGVWGGEVVDREYSRTDGCRISEWDGLAPLLPAAAGSEGGLAPPSDPPR